MSSSASVYPWWGENTASYGVAFYGTATTYGTAIVGSDTDTGGTGVSGDGGETGVYGSGTTYGVYGYSSAGDAIFGLSSTGSAVYGTAGSGFGVYGTSSSGNGMEGSIDNHWSAVAGVNAFSGTDCSTYPCAGIYGSGTTGTGGGFAGYFSGNVYVSGCVKYNGGTSGTCLSDERLKKDIVPVRGALTDVLKLRPVTYEWIHPGHGELGTQMGFIAQDVEKVKPEWVSVDEQGYKQINMGRLPPMLVESIQELQLQNDELRRRVQSLEEGRRPFISGFGEGGIGMGMAALAAALVFSNKRKRAS